MFCTNLNLSGREWPTIGSVYQLFENDYMPPYLVNWVIWELINTVDKSELMGHVRTFLRSNLFTFLNLYTPSKAKLSQSTIPFCILILQ